MKKKKELTYQQKKEKARKRCVKKAKEINKIESKRTCAYCGATNRMTHSHHLISEGLNPAMSADLDNLICLCWLHHLGGLKFVSSKTFSFHGTPGEANNWFEDKYPERKKELKERSWKSPTLTIGFWESKEEELDKKLKSINNK